MIFLPLAATAFCSDPFRFERLMAVAPVGMPLPLRACESSERVSFGDGLP